MLLLNQFLHELPEIVEQCPSTSGSSGKSRWWVGLGVGWALKHRSEHGGLWSPCLQAAAVKPMWKELILLKRKSWAVGRVRGEKGLSFLLALLLSILEQRCCVGWTEEQGIRATAYLMNQGWLTPKTALWAPEVCNTCCTKTGSKPIRLNFRLCVTNTSLYSCAGKSCFRALNELVTADGVSLKSASQALLCRVLPSVTVQAAGSSVCIKYRFGGFFVFVFFFWLD